MALADLHVHSIHSEHPSEWFLQKIGAAESYTDPNFIFNTAKNNGMNFVTITDHNRISGAILLQLQYPDTAFTSVETTAYFPEDGCKVHLLIYGLTERQFNEVQKLRKDIYQLRAYLLQEKLACSVAHATYSVNGRITLSHLERLILLFDVFESINGGRNQLNNDSWTESLHSLNDQIITDLYNDYNIEPMSDDPWIKGFTGGSDDHAGFFIARTYTYAEANTVQEYLKAIRDKKTIAGGRHNDYKSLAFTIYKIAYDFSKSKSKGFNNPIIKQITENLFEKKHSTIVDKLSFQKLFFRKKQKEEPLKAKVIELLEKLKTFENDQLDEKFDYVYSQIADLTDELFIQFANKLLTDLKTGNLFNLISGISVSLPGIFITAPFFTTLKHMFAGRELINQLKAKYLNEKKSEKKILWFSDTVNDLNGVSFIVKRITNIAQNLNKDIILTAALSEEDLKNKDLPSGLINLPYIYEFSLPQYESYLMRVPSILKTIEIIARQNPEEIYISTPGPVGLIGLLIGKLLSIKITGIYHTDFKLQYNAIDEDGGTAELIEAFTRWFYMSLDTIKVPTNEYMTLLADRGFAPEKMSLFRRGIEEELFYPVEHAKERLIQDHKIPAGFNLIYAGRISRDKNLEFMVNVYSLLLQKHEDLNLIIAGDGPFLDELKKSMKTYNRVFFLGKVDRNELALWYSGSDLFFFPSNTDTFGMVVLEAQACGLPAIVSDMGGPKEIVIDKETGYVVKADQLAEWVEKTSEIISLFKNNYQAYKEIRNKASQNVKDTCNWNLVIDEIMNDQNNQDIVKNIRKIPKW
ncbi:MAG TPA: glycosyltransferase [Candidatus Cloacimonadota bacterium]|nr:glycosyltransferase [Candidatus Cloacimonadota bacterium]